MSLVRGPGEGLGVLGLDEYIYHVEESGGEGRCVHMMRYGACCCVFVYAGVQLGPAGVVGMGSGCILCV